jgi:hypothetical protein
MTISPGFLRWRSREFVHDSQVQSYAGSKTAWLAARGVTRTSEVALRRCSGGPRPWKLIRQRQSMTNPRVNENGVPREPRRCGTHSRRGRGRAVVAGAEAEGPRHVWEKHRALARAEGEHLSLKRERWSIHE